MSENKRPAEMPMIRPGGRRGPGPGMQPVEKAKNGKQTLKRLIHFFRKRERWLHCFYPWL